MALNVHVGAPNRPFPLHEKKIPDFFSDKEKGGNRFLLILLPLSYRNGW